MAYVDFAALKARIPIAEAASRLGLILKPRHDQLRGPCPACKSGGDRALVITPAKQAFYCFGARTGGDVIALAAHIRGTDMKEAACFLHTAFGGPAPHPADPQADRPAGRPTVPGSPEERVRGAGQDVRALVPLTYLEPDHHLVRALGLSAETCNAFGAGYAPKGILRGRLAIPVHDWRTGSLVAYCGHTVRDETPQLLFPRDFDPAEHLFGGPHGGEGEAILMRDPLEVMLAHQNGIDGGTAFLTGTVTPAQLRMLAAMLDDKAIAALELA